MAVSVPSELAAPRIQEAPRTKAGYYEARPGDVVVRADLVLLDVRATEQELTGDLGHVHGAFHVPADLLESDGIPGLPQSTPVVVICQNGWRSRTCAVRLAADFGFTEVYHLVGGMIRWNAEERPVARTRTWRSFSE